MSAKKIEAEVSSMAGIARKAIIRKEFEEENPRLKKMYAEERFKAEVLREAMKKRAKGLSAA